MAFSTTISVFLMFSPGVGIASEIDQTLKSFEGLISSYSCKLALDLQYTCDSLSKLSCKEGDLNDGTGVSLSDQSYRIKVEGLSKKLIPIYEKKFLKMLQAKDQKSKITRDLAFKVTNQENTEKMAASLAAIAVKKVFSEPTGTPETEEDKTYNELWKNEVYGSALSKADDEAMPIVSEKQLDKKIKDKVFPNVKSLLIEKVKSSVANEKIRNALIKKIEKIEYLGNNYSFFNKKMSPTMGGLMNQGTNYSNDKNAFIYGNGLLLKNSSEFTMIYFIAHELAHSIDPCSIDDRSKSLIKYQYNSSSTIEDFEKQNPFANVISCLRSKESVGAKYQEYETFLENKKTYEKSGLGLMGNNPFCATDQIGESFADWVAGEILPEYTSKHLSGLTQEQRLNGYANTTRSMCKTISTPVFNEHPETQARLDRILMANPRSRQQVGCGPPKDDLHHCSVKENFIGTRVPPLSRP